MKVVMDQTFKFFTDTASITAFDPQRIENRVDDEADWWCGDLLELDEIQTGAATIVLLGGDGYFQARVTDGDLTDVDRDYAADVVKDLGVEVVSGKLIIGPGECLPGEGCRANDERGMTIQLENGQYSVDVYFINWRESARWYTEDEVAPGDAPAEFVIQIRPRTESFTELEDEPMLDDLPDDFLFESSTRQVGPEPGLTLVSKVRKGADGTLLLKDCC